MKVRYIGESFGAMSLTNGKIYKCLDIKPEIDMIKIIDDSGEDYIYPIINPRPLDESSKGGKWEIIEDKDDKFKKAFISLGILNINEK